MVCYSRRLRAGVLIAAACALAACGNSRPVSESEYNTPETQGGDRGKLLGDQGLVLGVAGKRPGSQTETSSLGVNAYLWRGALDTLSFMPLASADPFGGVIITDWYQSPAARTERFKATAYILGRQLRADGVRVRVFRQVSQGGRWTDDAVSPQVVAEIEDKVLARARELRAQTAQN